VNLKYRLLVNFIAVVLIAVAVFGVIAYQISEELTVDAVRETVRDASSLSGEAIALVRRAERQGLDLRHEAPLAHDDGHIVMLVDADHRLLSRVPDHAQHWPLTEMLRGGDASGNLEHDGEHYAWSRVALPPTSHHLLYAARIAGETRRGLSRLAARLTVTGLVVMWAAVWVALILATMVSRRLDAQTRALQHQATHDSLTGLPNRTLLHERLTQAIRTADAKSRSVSLIVMDLDRFKEINDTLGHPVGDRLLQAIGERMRTSLWGSDTIARLGGDEFALLLPLADSSHTTQVIDKIFKVLAEPFVIEGMSFEVEASLGVAVYPEDGRNAIELISHADVAMYLAKRRGERAVRYEAGLDPHSVERLQLMGDLRRAAERGELSLYYQPKIESRGQRLAGAEALLRWRHPQLGMVPPDRFIPQAEQTGIIKPLSLWVLDEALRQCAAWEASGLTVPVSINLSARLVQDTQLPEAVAAALERHALRPELLKIEITETAIMSDPTRAMQVLTALDALGVGLSIDDFGTGYTSLAQLKRLPVDEVKIDRAFVMSMLRDANDAIIVHSIIELAHNMNRVVVAEGVENRKVLDALVAQRCDEVQGYYFSRPLPAAEFADWVTKWSVTPGEPVAVRAVGG
jgi:diguanylate cyclase (GGDEF)-like protein